MRIFQIVVVGLVCGGSAGCGNSAPDAKAPGEIASVVVPTAVAQAEPPTSAEPAPEASGEPKKPAKKADPVSTSLPAAPVQVAGPTAPSGGNAVVVGAASAPTTALQAFAATDAAGMLPAGVTLAASFKTGDTLEFELTLLPGRCYTILATGAPTIQQLDLQMGIQIPTLPGFPPAVLAQGTGTTSAAIGGKGSGCYKNPMPIAMPATVTLKVSSGTGIAGTQVYAK